MSCDQTVSSHVYELVYPFVDGQASYITTLSTKFNAHFQHDGQDGLDIWIDILFPELLSLLQNEVASEHSVHGSSRTIYRT